LTQPLVIGLVNNMPKAAKRGTEAEFTALIAAASSDTPVRLCCFDITGAASPEGNGNNSPLWETALDALIVTGTEPVASAMTDEPSWPALVKLIDWAGHHTISTIWSCLAAQAAVLRLDGIVRQALPTKLSGIFTVSKHADHALTTDAPQRWPVPHSRYNGLDADTLLRNDYQILSYGPSVGPDMFTKTSGRSAFVFLQGHPEYSADCLLREYRRDLRHYLLGRRLTCPALPENYFADDIAGDLTAQRQELIQTRDPNAIAAFDAVARAPLEAAWFTDATRLYKNWLHSIVQNKNPATAAERAYPQSGLVLS
jgi:homoserine O-succinyltransferase